MHDGVRHVRDELTLLVLITNASCSRQRPGSALHDAADVCRPQTSDFFVTYWSSKLYKVMFLVPSHWSAAPSASGQKNMGKRKILGYNVQGV